MCSLKKLSNIVFTESVQDIHLFQYNFKKSYSFVKTGSWNGEYGEMKTDKVKFKSYFVSFITQSNYLELNPLFLLHS